VRIPIAFVLSFLCVFALGRPAAAQTTSVWNYSSTDPTLSGSWTNGVPGSGDTAVFNTFAGTTYNLPSFSQNAAIGDVRFLGLRPIVDTVFAGSGHTLTVGTGGSMTTAPLAVRGSIGGPAGGTLAFNNLTVNIATGTTFASGSFEQQVGAVELSGSTARFDLRNGSQLRLIDAAGTTNYDLTLNSGAGIRVNAGTTLTNGVGVNTNPQGSIRFQGGGTVIVQGANDVASTFTLNQVVAASGHSSVSVFAGLDTVTSGTPSVQLTIGNGSIQSGISRDVRDSAGNLLGHGVGTIEFTFSAAAMPGFTGSVGQVFLAPGASGIAVQNGVITEGTSASTNSPYVILTGSIPNRTGSLGRFATINSTTGEVTAQTGTARTEANLSSVAVNENVVYRPTTTTANATVSGSISPQTVVFEAQASGQSVTLGTGVTLTTPGIIVERPTTGTSVFTFSLNGGTLAGPGTSQRNIFVLGLSSTVFNVSSTFASGGDIVKSGGGTLALTGNTPQMDFTGNVIINQGALRAKIDGATANFGTSNTLLLRGGVFEVDAGGSTSTFSRNLGTGAGEVNWTRGTNYADRGGGGFSVVNGNLDVNIGGAGQTLVWHGTSGGNEYFLRSGQSLRFGSGQSNGVVTLVNNLALDDGSVGLPFESRQIVTDSLTSVIPTSALRTRITGVISGSASTGLMKSGNAMLELTAANTYAGGTIVDQGALLVSNTSGSATGTGRVVVYGLLLGNGTIAPSSGNGVTIMPSPVSGANGLALYRDQYAGTPGNLTIGSAGTNNPVTLRSGVNALFQLNGTTFDPAGGSTSYSRLTVKGTGTVTVDGAALTVGLNTGFTPSGSDVFVIVDNQTDTAISGTFNGLADGATVNAFFPNNAAAGTFQITYFANYTGSSVSLTGGNDIALYGFVPVPEPAAVLGLCAVAVGLVGLTRRVRGRRVV
jgi:fibronectin-binding autotransporter adhesin